MDELQERMAALRGRRALMTSFQLGVFVGLSASAILLCALRWIFGW